MRVPCKTSSKMLRSAERRLRILALRKGGNSLRDIALALGISVPRVHFVLTSELKTLGEERAKLADHVRNMELLRLDDLQKAIWNKAIAGRDYGALDRVLAIIALRARLTGAFQQTEEGAAYNGGPRFVLIMPDNGRGGADDSASAGSTIEVRQHDG